MKVIDLNILLYAINQDSAHHGKVRPWLESVLNQDEPVALPWIVLLGFLRLTTNPRIMPKPLSTEEAMSVIDGWLNRPVVLILHPGEEHWRILRELLRETGSAGNLTTDAHLAALAIENGCELCSTDTDFGRFKQLKSTNPLSST